MSPPRCQRVVVHLLASPFFGGPERQVLGLATHLSPLYRTVFLSFHEGGLAEPFLRRAQEVGQQTISLKHNAPSFAACIREVTNHLQEQNADLLCCHGYKPDLIGLAAARRAKVPVIGICRGWTAATWKVRMNEGADRLSLHGMHRVVCVSESQAKKVRRLGISDRRISVIHNAIDYRRLTASQTADRDELRSFFRVPVSQIVVAAGRLSPEKGFGDLVNAAALINAQNRNVGFLLFGEGPLRESLLGQIINRNLQETFILGGFRSDIDRLLPQADLVAIPSYTEGLPNIALEAHAASKAIVATNVGGIPEVVQDGVTGHLVDAGDSQALADRILQLLLEGTLRNEMGVRGFLRVKTHFTFEAQSEKYERVFEQIIDDSRATKRRTRQPVVSCKND